MRTVAGFTHCSSQADRVHDRHHYHQRICSNTDDAVALLQYSMAVSLGGHLMMPSEAPEGLKAFHVRYSDLIHARNPSTEHK